MVLSYHRESNYSSKQAGVSQFISEIFGIMVVFMDGEPVIIEIQINKEYDFEKRSRFII